MAKLRESECSISRTVWPTDSYCRCSFTILYYYDCSFNLWNVTLGIQSRIWSCPFHYLILFPFSNSLLLSNDYFIKNSFHYLRCYWPAATSLSMLDSSFLNLKDRYSSLFCIYHAGSEIATSWPLMWMKIEPWQPEFPGCCSNASWQLIIKSLNPASKKFHSLF